MFIARQARPEVTRLSAGRYAGLGPAQTAVGRLWSCCGPVCNEASSSLPVPCPPPRPILLHNLPLNIQHQMSKKTRKIARKPSNERVRECARMPCTSLTFCQRSPHGTASEAQGSSLVTKVKAKLRYFRKGVPPNATLGEVCPACVCNRRPFDKSWQGVIP